MFKLILVAATVMLPLCLSSCNNSNPASSTAKPYFVAFLNARDDYWDDRNDKSVTAQNISIDLWSFNAPKVSSLSFKINNKAPDLSFSNASNTGFWGETYSDGIFLNESFSGAKSVTINSDLGSASAQIEIPNPTIITSHQDLDTVSPFSSIVVTWNGNADYYGFYARASDTDYNSTTLFDTIVVGNSFTVPVNKITPITSRVYITVSGNKGSQPIAGSPGNISGDGKGFVFASNSSGDSNKWDITLYMRGRLNKALAKTSAQNPRHLSAFQKKILNTLTQN